MFDNIQYVTFHTQARLRHNAEFEKNFIHHQQAESAELWIGYSPAPVPPVFLFSATLFCAPETVF